MIWIPFLRKLPIRGKLILIIMVASVSVLLLAAAAFSVNEHFRARRSMARDISALGRLIADRSTAALVFDDPNMCAENLAALRGIPSVLGAGMFKEDGSLAARYRKLDASLTHHLPGESLSGSHRFEGEQLIVFEPVLLEGKAIGTVVIRAGLDDLKVLSRQYFLSAFAILCLGGLAAYLLASWLQKIVSGPISKLTETTHLITSAKNFSVRAAKDSDDELGMLVEAFNGMLEQIQDRDRGLQQANDRLESQVRARTAELHEANEQLGAVFQAANVGIVVLRDRIIQQCNSKLEEIFGYGPGEFNGQPTRLWYLDEADHAIGGEPVYEQLWRGATHQREQLLRRKDGSTFWARITGRALVPNEPLVGVVGVIEDITPEREYAESLRQAVERAEAADRIKSAFLATMSHELRTPLNSIIGFTGILLQGLVGELNPEQKKQLGMVKDSSSHLLDLINDVLDLSKIEAGQLKLNDEEFDLRASTEKLVQATRPLAEKKGISLELHIAENVPRIKNDQRRVEQVLLNLLSNAIKFTERGSVRVGCLTRDGKVLLQVRDSGIGIKPEDVERLFKPFSQIDTGLTRKYEGTGLGLSICKRLVELMGGEIWVESRPNEGSTFAFTLPLR